MTLASVSPTLRVSAAVAAAAGGFGVSLANLFSGSCGGAIRSLGADA